MKQDLYDKAKVHDVVQQTGGLTNLGTFEGRKPSSKNPAVSREAIDAHIASRLVKQTPRNLMDVPSAYDLSPD